MKKLLGIVVLGLLLSSDAYAELITLKCKNKNSKATYPNAFVEIDLKNNKLNYEHLGWTLNLQTVTPYYVQALYIVEGENLIWWVYLDRYSGDLKVFNSDGDSKEVSGVYLSKRTGNFKCKKIDKVF